MIDFEISSNFRKICKLKFHFFVAKLGLPKLGLPKLGLPKLLKSRPTPNFKYLVFTFKIKFSILHAFGVKLQKYNFETPNFEKIFFFN